MEDRELRGAQEEHRPERQAMEEEDADVFMEADGEEEEPLEDSEASDEEEEAADGDMEEGEGLEELPPEEWLMSMIQNAAADPEAFDDWRSPPNATSSSSTAPAPNQEPSRQVAWPSLEAQELWSLPARPLLGGLPLERFGPNGPPMNVMDVCPATSRLFIANQRLVLGFSIIGLDRLGEGATRWPDDEWAAAAPAVNAQVNRLRCGQIGSRPAVVVVDAAGGVTIMAADTDILPVSAAMQNGRISTWGIAMARATTNEPRSSSHCTGDLIVSANDHCVKAWTLAPPRLPGSEENQGDAEASHHQQRESKRRTEQWQVIGPGPRPVPATAAVPRVLQDFNDNLPCLDFAAGRVLASSLDGSVRSFPLHEEAPKPRESTSAEAGATTAAEPETAQGPEPREPEAAEPPAVPKAAPRSAPPCLYPPPGSTFEFRAPEGSSRRMWNACWLPVKSLRVVSQPGVPPQQSRDVNLDWTVGTGAEGAATTLPAELITSFVLPFLGAVELLSIIQPLSNGHAEAARQEVAACKRDEHIALAFSEDAVWLLDSQLKPRCRRRLPFDGTFAHISAAHDFSSVIVATKMDLESPQLWAVTVLRSLRAIRFRLVITPLLGFLNPFAGHWPAGVIVGMAAGPKGRLFTLLAGQQLVCHQLRWVEPSEALADCPGPGQPATGHQEAEPDGRSAAARRCSQM